MKNLVLILALLFTPYDFVHASETNKGEDVDVLRPLNPIFPRFGTISQKEEEQFLANFVRNIRLREAELIKELTSGSNDAKCAAAYMLGVLRSRNAVESLATNIELRDISSRQSHREWFWGLNPAVNALVEIGGPSIPAMVKNIEETDDPAVRALSLKVIHFIERDSEIELLRLKRAIQQQGDAQKKARLQAAIAELQEAK